MRVLQGFALGGEYGGRGHLCRRTRPPKKRGYLTGWIQTTAALGLIGALSVILITRQIVGVEAFDEWGWRIPFLLSALLLAMSLWIRLKLNESPAYQRMEAEGHAPRALQEAFGPGKTPVRADGPGRDHVRPGRGLVLRLFLQPLLHGAVAEDGRQRRSTC
jgi:MFS family permease